MTTETQSERQARWAANRERQAAWRRDEWPAIREARIAAGDCVLNDALNWCITHDVRADLGHDLVINGHTRPDGTARND